MQIEYQAKGIEVSRALDTWLRKRLKKFARVDASADARVILRKNQEKGPVEVDLLLRTQWGTIQSKYHAYDERTALSRALTKIEEQFRRFKEKSTLGRRRMTAEALSSLESTRLQPVDELRVRRVPLRSLPLMSLEEALNQLRDGAMDFVIFRDLENQDRVMIVYPDTENAIALIELPIS